MVKVSIIIPVHNTSQYLDRCFKSCLDQTLEEIEIIAVDDFSTDNSAEIIKRYEEKYPEKFKGVYLPENIRQGGARNVGIRLAKGEYCAFVDSDDFIKEDMCRTLYEYADGADLCGGDFCEFDENGNIVSETEFSFTDSDVGVMTPEKREYYFLHYGMFWTRIFRRDFLIENELFFPERLFFEDAWFNFMTSMCAKTIRKTKGFFYCYYLSPNSTTRNKKDKRKFERITIARLIFDDCKKRGLYEENKNSIDEKFLSLCAGNILYNVFSDFEKENMAYLYEIQRDVKARIPNYRKTKSYKNMHTDNKMFLDLTVRSPKVAEYLHNNLQNIFVRIVRKALRMTVYR